MIKQIQYVGRGHLSRRKWVDLENMKIQKQENTKKYKYNHNTKKYENSII